MKNAKLILTHVGNKVPDYVHYSLQHLRLHNQETVIYFIADESLQDDRFFKTCSNYNIISIDSNKYKNDPLIVELNSVAWLPHECGGAPGTAYPSQPQFWHLTMERIYYLYCFAEDYDIDDFYHIENDNVVFYNFNEADRYTSNKITCLKRTSWDATNTLFSFVHVPTHKALFGICRTINNIMCNGKEYVYSRYKVPYIAHEMMFLEEYRKMGRLRLFPTLPSSDYTFDAVDIAHYLFGGNNFQLPGYCDEHNDVGVAISNNVIKPILIDKTPYLESSNGLHKVFNLHMHRKNIEDLL